MSNPLFEAFEANRDLERHLNREWKRIRRERNMIPRWKTIYSCFALDIGLPPSLNHRIERIDPNLRWEAANVRWVLSVGFWDADLIGAWGWSSLHSASVGVPSYSRTSCGSQFGRPGTGNVAHRVTVSGRPLNGSPPTVASCIARPFLRFKSAASLSEHRP